MNNGSSLNRTTINGWLGDVTVRIQIIAYASAVGNVIGRVWRRSVVAGESVAAGTEGRVWRRGPVSAQAEASASVVSTIKRMIYLLINNIAQATAVITAKGKPQTNVFSPVNSVARATLTSSGGKRNSRLIFSGTASASAAIKVRVLTRASVSGVARAEAFIHDDVNRQIPWDEYAPDYRKFLVQPEPHIFTVVN